MARPASRYPTELELEILKILWGHEALNVTQVQSRLGRELAYSSVITIMNIMVGKGYLTRRKEGASFRFQPAITEKATTRRMLKDLVNRAFDGSVSAVVVSLLESADLDKGEIARLRELLGRKAKEGGQ